jgi:hypothetical protein
LFSGFASVPFTVDGASETENPKETPKPEEVVRMLVDQIREGSYAVRKQRGVLEVATGYDPLVERIALKRGLQMAKVDRIQQSF